MGKYTSLWILSSVLAVGACVDDEPDTAATVAPLLTNGETVRSGGFCLDTYYGAGDAGTPVFVWTCHGTVQQRWSVTPDGLFRSASGMCLEAVAAGTANYTPLALWPCHGLAHQRWRVEANNLGSDHYQIRGEASGKCLTRWGNDIGSDVVLLPCDKSLAQDWTGDSWTHVVNGYYPTECWAWRDYATGALGTSRCDTATYESTAKFGVNGGPINFYDPWTCIEADGYSLFGDMHVADGAKVRAKPCSGRANQKWTWDNGMLRTVDNRCITRWWTSGGASSGGYIELRANTCNGHGWQRWSAVDDGSSL